MVVGGLSASFLWGLSSWPSEPFGVAKKIPFHRGGNSKALPFPSKADSPSKLFLCFSSILDSLYPSPNFAHALGTHWIQSGPPLLFFVHLGQGKEVVGPEAAFVQVATSAKEHSQNIATVLDYITHEIFSVDVHQTKESWELPFADDQTALDPNEEILFPPHFQPHVALLHLSSVLHIPSLLESSNHRLRSSTSVKIRVALRSGTLQIFKTIGNLSFLGDSRFLSGLLKRLDILRSLTLSMCSSCDVGVLASLGSPSALPSSILPPADSTFFERPLLPFGLGQVPFGWLLTSASSVPSGRGRLWAHNLKKPCRFTRPLPPRFQASIAKKLLGMFASLEAHFVGQLMAYWPLKENSYRSGRAIPNLTGKRN